MRRNPPTSTPFGGVVLGPFDGETIPDGCVVYSDGQDDWIVFAPGLVAQMRDDCPICAAGGVHAS